MLSVGAQLSAIHVQPFRLKFSLPHALLSFSSFCVVPLQAHTATLCTSKGCSATVIASCVSTAVPCEI